MNTIDPQKVSNHFKRSIDTYDDGAVVQRDVSLNLISLLDNFPQIDYDRVLEIGCCTGSMTEVLCRNNMIKQLWLNDIVAECTEVAAERIGSHVVQTHCLGGDISTTAIPGNLDLVISASTFQWVADLPRCFDTFCRSLNDRGYLVFSLFAKGTMEQVRELLGIGLSYLDEIELANILKRNFIVEHIKTTRHTLHFKNPREVLRHIQKTGVGGAGEFCWTPSRLRKFERDYIHKFGDGQGVPLDYVSISVIAKKKQGNES